MKKSISNFLLGFLAGAAAGAVAGILFAPDKGSTTRQNIKKKVRELSDEYNLGLGDLIDELGIETDNEPVVKTKAGKRKPKDKKQKEQPVEKQKRKYNPKPKLASN